MPEAPSLFPDAVDAPSPPGRGKHGYYRLASGWITTGPTTPSNRSAMEYKGATFLPQYGEFANGTAAGAPQERDARGVAWNPADEPWRMIFQRGGGKEFPADQIIAYRWHVRPPYREVTFPQLDGVRIFDLQCPECDRGLFSSTNENDAAQMLKTHLTTGTNNRHSYTPSDLRALAQEYNLDFDQRRIGTNAVRSVQVEEPEPVPELTPAEDVLSCGECGWSPPPEKADKAKSLRMHRMHHEKSRTAGGSDIPEGDREPELLAAAAP